MQYSSAGAVAAHLAAAQVYSVAKRGADFWVAHLFSHKTYVEARSAANPFIAFWRVYAFHTALLTAMGALVSICLAVATMPTCH
jgi:hypothetical protein